jgi:hypothetical protein
MKLICLSVAFTSLLPLTAPAAFMDLDQASSLSDNPVSFQVPGKSQLVEHCLPLKTFPDSKLKKRRKKEELKLCRYDLYGVGSSTESKIKQVAACPKTYNSSTAIEFYKIPKGMSKSEFQRKICPLGRHERKRWTDSKGYPKKLAKFKFTSPGVTTGSILGYYQLARFFGAAEVPASVLRTVDADFALNMSLTGLYLARKAGSDFLSKYWSRQTYIFVNSMGHDSSSVPRSIAGSDRYGLGIVPDGYFRNRSRLQKVSLNYWYNRQLSDDFRQVVGVLAANPRGEKYYAEISGVKRRRTRIAQFKRGSVHYPAIKSNRSLERILGSRDLKTVGQKLKGMKDTSNLLVLDFLMDQADRVGNIHYYNYFYYKDGEGKVKKIREDRYKKLTKRSPDQLSDKQRLTIEQVKASGAKIKVMLLKDNDGGFDENKAKKYHLLADVDRSSSSYKRWRNSPEIYKNASMVVKHFDPKVYQRVIKLYRWLIEDESGRREEMRDYLQNVVHFTDSEMTKFKNNLTALYNALYTNCRSGKIHLDLAMKDYFSNQPSSTNLSASQRCEGL